MLTIGMPCFRDFDGVVFTVQSLRLHQDLEGVEILVVDDFGCPDTEAFARGAGIRYLRTDRSRGPAAAKDAVFRHAAGDAVLCLDSHVLLVPGAVARLRAFLAEHPRCDDLLQGPLLMDDLDHQETHLEPVWRGFFFGTWATDPRGLQDEPFEIPMQGMGLFACRKRAWPGFHAGFSGFGGEEGYIHEKFRQAGRRTLCLPWMKWWHRFGRPNGIPYQVILEDRLRNYLLGWTELGLPIDEVLDHFAAGLHPDVLDRLVKEVVGARLERSRPLPLVGCLCPTYNRAPRDLWLVEEAIESFLRQDHPHRELLILNDTPGQTLRFDHPQVRVFNELRRFPNLSAKLNYLVERSTASHFCRWDDDDLSLPWRLSLSLRRLGEDDYWKPERWWTGEKKIYVRPGSEECIGHQHAVFTRRLFDRVGGFRARRSEEDVVFENDVRAKGVPIRRESLPDEALFYVYRWNTGSRHVSGFGLDGYDRLAEDPIVRGEFGLRPHWRTDYVEYIRRRCLPASFRAGAG